MAARNTANSGRFVYRPPDRESEPYHIPMTRSGSVIAQTTTLPSARPVPTIIRSADAVTPRTDAETSARRVVFIRSIRHPQANEEPEDLDDFARRTPPSDSPRYTDGHKTLFLIRRPVAQREPSRLIEYHSPVREPSPTNSIEYRRTYTPSFSPPPPEILPSPDPYRSPSPRPKSSKRPENSQRYVPYLRRPRSKPRTPSPVQPIPIRRSPSAHRTRRKPPKRRSPSPPPPAPVSPPQQEEFEEIDHKPGFASFYWLNTTNEPFSPSVPPPPAPVSPPQQKEFEETDHKPGFASFYRINTTDDPVRPSPPPSLPPPPTSPPVINENAEEPVQYRSRAPEKSAQQKKPASPRAKSTNSRAKSAKSVVLVHPEDQSVVIIENANVKGESLRPIIKTPRSFKKTRFEDEINDESTEPLVKTSRWQTCLGCLSRHMCLILIICFLLVLIGLAGVGVSAYYLANYPLDNSTAKTVGIAVGGALAIAALCFFYIILACLGSRDGYFSYNGDDPPVGGRVFAMIPPTHSNAHLYIPSDYMKAVERSQAAHTRPHSNIYYSQHSSSSMQAVSSASHNRQLSAIRSISSGSAHEMKSKKKNITIEMPERLVTGERLSPRTRERSLNNVVKNIGHIVEDAKKRYNGDVPNKVIVKVDRTAS